MSEQNGAEPDVVTIPRELLQAMLDYLGTCPAAQVYPLLRRLETEIAAPLTEQPSA